MLNYLHLYLSDPIKSHVKMDDVLISTKNMFKVSIIDTNSYA